MLEESKRLLNVFRKPPCVIHIKWKNRKDILVHQKWNKNSKHKENRTCNKNAYCEISPNKENKLTEQYESV